jgi:uncharacterized membrane protein (UPF0127 family)
MAAVVLILIICAYVITRPVSFRQSVVQIGERRFLVELADTSALRERGLGFRDTLPSGRGMLFLFPDVNPDRYAFWMKGMRFPLDIAWIRDGRVVYIERDIPFDSRDIFRPPIEADSVLETNASELSDITPGESVLFSRDDSAAY